MNMLVDRVATNLSFGPLKYVDAIWNSRAQPRKARHVINMIPCNQATQNSRDSMENGWQITSVESLAFGEFSILILSSAPDMRYLSSFADQLWPDILDSSTYTPWGWGEGGNAPRNRIRIRYQLGFSFLNRQIRPAHYRPNHLPLPRTIRGP